MVFFQSCGNVAYVPPEIAGDNLTNATQLEESLFLDTAMPSNDSRTDGPNVNYELGAVFAATVEGEIRSIRYFKSPMETGTHIGHIFSSVGEILAQVTFTSETASGWQEQKLAQPLPIKAGNNYVV